MTLEQAGIFAILAITALLFIWGRWRHDLVALGALIACVVAGLVDPAAAFSGFGNPAVITVASVLILSFSLQTTGVVDTLSAKVLPSSSGNTVSIIALSALAAGLSAFMNNVGALALLMPVAIKTASRLGISPGRVLMPVSFASILGGMTTLTGTPPNLIVAGFSGQGDSSSFTMFDFAPVGLAVTAAGLILIALAWKLVPARERTTLASFETAPYIIEARVKQDSSIIGQSLRDIEYQLDTTDAQIVSLLRNDRRISAPNPYREVRADDVLVIEADPDAIGDALSKLGLVLDTVAKAEEKAAEEKEQARDNPDAPGKEEKATQAESRLQSGDVVLMELAVRPNALLLGLSIKLIDLRREFGVNLIALSRDGKDSMARLNSTPIRSGDVLLVQGTSDAILEFANRYGCVPLAERALKIPNSRKAVLAAVIMILAICGAAFGLLPAAITFAAGVLAVALFKVVPLRKLYEPIDWPVVVLLGALIPVAGAMSTTGAADLIAQGLITASGGSNPVYTMIILLVVTMTLSDFMNNAATAAVMCPIALGAASQLGVNPDTYLMAVAIGASCAFLTPIGHQNNALILGPGGFRFGDYWRLGLPMEVVVIVAATPMLLWVWPL
ncbi:TrkA domain protein [Hyphomonas neptunium ATCC 15444]|uniref:TrkA domain protein n=2 Tax=Hyphomonas TaxID=85 RepID=Q0BZQ1_HYPNA|nr:MULTISPECIES: SLC13 family permease [Hyphomonas]ABI76175.1 TrkA domain protein [Hyphomonas neptunium ATCC 15444]KCZ86741.1 TrkA domain-containing protein [Hyphomonas hirschiana VP5]